MRRRSYASEGSHEPASARRGHQAPRERTHESNVRSGVAIPCSACTAQHSHARTSHTQQKGELMEKFKMIMEVINACLQAIWNALFKS